MIPTAEVATDRGFTSVLRVRPFLFLWLAQMVSQTAFNGIHFVQMVLIERLTGSSGHIGIMILAFSLPGVLLSSVAGVVVDRLSNKSVMLASNALRVLTVSGYIVLLMTVEAGIYLLIALYVLTFVSSAIGQFFSPAEAATIPLLVGEDRLLTANALFNLTLIGTQVAGLIVLAPLAVKALGIGGAFALVAAMYLIATVLTTFLPKDAPQRSSAYLAEAGRIGASALRAGWDEVREGWRFVAASAPVTLAILQLTLIVTLLLIMAMLAPGFAARVLRMSPEDAVFVFAPAGVGMLLNAFLVGRFGHRFRRQTLINGGFVALGLTLAGLAWVSIQPGLAFGFSRAAGVSGLSFFLGVELAAITIPAQTVLQERSPAEIRGRVFAVYFMLANLVGIPPLLFIGTIADRLGPQGIPIVTAVVGAALVVVGAVSGWRARLLPARAAGEPFPASDG
ncbi:MAG: MFS transporter [Anaerolineae bacterium]